MPLAHRRLFQRFSIWHAGLLLPWPIASYGFARTFNDNSYLWHVRAGDLQIGNGSVLTTDPFSFTAQGVPWRTQSWLAELFYSWIDARWGLEAAPFLTAMLGSLLFLLLALAIYRISRSLVSTTVLLVLSSVVIAGFLNPRPVIFSFPLFAAVVLSDGDRRLRWSLPLLMWIWASLHGSFVIGLAYVGLSVLRRGLRMTRVLEVLAIGLPTLATAHGLGVLQVLADFAKNSDAVALMSEWDNPDLLSGPFFPVLIGLFGIVWLAQQGHLAPRDWFLLLPFMILVFSANRAVPPAWIALVPILSRLRLPVRATLNVSPIAILLALSVVALPFLYQSDERVDLERFPVAAAQYVTGERVFHDDAAGGWLIYEQWPDRLVYVDDRAELYGEQMRRFVDTRAGRGVWSEEFDRWEIDQALLQLGQPLVEVLRLAGWEEIYSDDNHIVLERPG